MQHGGHHLEPQGSRATPSAVRWVALHIGHSHECHHCQDHMATEDAATARSAEPTVAATPAPHANCRALLEKCFDHCKLLPVRIGTDAFTH